MADDDRPPPADEPPGDAERTGDPEPTEPLREDPETGSTPTDPVAEETGPYGTDPMAGPAPSG